MKLFGFLKNPKIVLVLIIILATALRIINLANWPVSFNQDEALNGYEAYSILKTGHDHRGNFLPIFFEGFSDRVDNRLPLYIYITVPFVAVFGLNEFSIRLPSAIFGLLTILITYFLTRKLFQRESVALLASFFLAISPWHIFLSRLGLEGILMPLLFLSTILFFLKGLREKKIYILLAGASLALLFYTYHVAKLLVPLLGVTLIFFFRKEVWQNRRWVVVALIIFFLISLPFLFLQLKDWTRIQGRFDQVKIFNFSVWPLIFIYNLSTYLAKNFLLNYYPFFVIIFFIVGLVFWVLKKSSGRKMAGLLWVLIFVSLAPASLTTINPHFMRSAILLPFFEIIAALGLVRMIEKIRGLKNNVKVYVLSLVLFFLLITPLNLVFLVKNNYPDNFCVDQGHCSYIPKEVIDYIKVDQHNYKKIVFTDKVNQPYVFFLFFLRYQPEDFQSLKVDRRYASNNWQIIDSFDKYHFCDINQCYSPDKNNLYIARPEEVPELKTKKIFYASGSPIFKVITND